VAERYYFEDFAVGQIFRSSTIVVDRAGIKAFAAEFDPQPMHLDEEAAAASTFRGLAASGWHTCALVMRLIVAGGGLPAIEGGIIGTGVERLAWIRPVRAGDRLRVESEVIAGRRSRVRPDRGLVSLRIIALNQDDKPIMEMTPTLIVPCRKPAGEF
jgi:acyl dehydratase